MKKFNLLFASALSLSLGFFGCSGDDSPSAVTGAPTGGADNTAVTPVDNGVTPSTGGSVLASPLTNPNITQTNNQYAAWKAGHILDYTTEAGLYPSVASTSQIIFGPFIAQGLVPARVVWQNTTMGNCWNDEAYGGLYYKRGCTVSEGIGYGMLITVFQGDMATYNGLWTYSKGYREADAYSNGKKLMPWLTRLYDWDVLDQSSATDADLDIATSLIIAYYKTGNAMYLEDAKGLVNAIWTHEINPNGNLIYSGDTPMWKTADPAYNPSYFSPVALRLFAMIDQSHPWLSVLDAMYAYMAKILAGGSGVFPDWANTAGVPVNPDNNSADKTYWTFNKESVRIPWRLAWDYYWFGEERAANILTSLYTFIAGKTNNNPAAIPGGTYYSWYVGNASFPDIKPSSATATIPTQWVGAWCLTAMPAAMQGNANARTWLDQCATTFNGIAMNPSPSSYFTDILYMMFSQLLNGAYQKPF